MKFRCPSLTLVREKDETALFTLSFFLHSSRPHSSKSPIRVQTDTHTSRLALLPDEKDASLITPFKIAERAEAKQNCDNRAEGPIAAAPVCCRSLLYIKAIR